MTRLAAALTMTLAVPLLGTSLSAADAADSPGDGTQAAVVHGWGQRTGGDEFEGGIGSQWFAYNSPGHAGQGLRRPSQLSVSGGVLTIAGTADGTTGGMGSTDGHRYGRRETRMKVPSGDARYHPVLLLWPDAEDWPSGGEVDYAETTAASSGVSFFLHYSASNQQTYGSSTVDITQWHNYAVEWSPSGITGYVDGVPFFRDTNPAHQPPRSMHPSIQLDWFPQGSSPTTPSYLQVAWQRYYPL